MRLKQLPPKADSDLPSAQVNQPSATLPNTGQATLFDGKFDLASVIELQDTLTQVRQLQQEKAALEQKLAAAHQELALTRERGHELSKQQSRTDEMLLITEARLHHQSEVNTALSQSHHELVQEHQQLYEFLRRIAHESRAPLRGINSLTRWIAEDFSDQLGKTGHDQINLLLACVEKLQPLMTAVEMHPRTAPSSPERNEHPQPPTATPQPE